MPIQTPFNLLSPEMLAQMAQAAFKPPQPMSMGGAGQQQRPQQPGFNIGQGIAGLAAGLDGWKPAPGGGAPGPGAQPGEDRASAPQWPPPLAGAATGGGGGGLSMPDFFSGSWMPKLGFTPPGGGFTGGGSSGWGG